MIEFTQEEFLEFKELYDMSGSSDQMDRIESRMYMPLFVETHGDEKCQVMADIIDMSETKGE